MSKQNIEESVESRVCFEELEDWVREKIQGWVQGHCHVNRVGRRWGMNRCTRAR